MMTNNEIDQYIANVFEPKPKREPCNCEVSEQGQWIGIWGHGVGHYIWMPHHNPSTNLIDAVAVITKLKEQKKIINAWMSWDIPQNVWSCVLNGPGKRNMEFWGRNEELTLAICDVVGLLTGNRTLAPINAGQVPPLDEVSKV